ncbi:MAG TPA: ABC transporter ATP-binding protein [Acidothermaceae bacterium]|nr:ABC transporter ATP-binding protein [Acidothermaceae bacterium]
MTSGTDRRLPPSGHEVQVAAAVKRYGAVTALAGVDLLIAPGTFLVLLGRSGSGKSTLARALAGVERLDAGEIRLGDALVSAGRRHLPPERRNLAMVFQDYALWPHLTALGNVAYALRRRHLGAVEEARRANDALERVGLVGLAARYPHELSGGEQQRVALARAVVARPGLLIFDEPLSNLDADLRERLRVEIATLTRESGATAVYITHDQSEAFALADMIAVLDRGSLVQLGTPEDIYHRPANAFVARFTGLAGELPGRVVSVSDGEAVVATANSRIRARCDSTLQPGQDAVVLVRPAATTLAASSKVGDGVLTGTVIDVAYRGRGYDHVIACEAGTLSAVFDTGAHPRGSTVHVALDPKRTMAHISGDHDVLRTVEELTAVTIST